MLYRTDGVPIVEKKEDGTICFNDCGVEIKTFQPSTLNREERRRLAKKRKLKNYVQTSV